MKDIYLINYSVKGIKALDEWVHLSFYKKTITNTFDIRNYNIKGIYGTNGAGKSAIMTSLKILKSLLIDDAYLSNPLVQKQLEEIVNKRAGKIEYDIQFLVNYEDGLRLYNYLISVGKKNSAKWSIIEEKLFFRNAVSHSSHMDLLFHAADAIIKYLPDHDEITTTLIEQTRNLLSGASLTATSINILKESTDGKFLGLMFRSGIGFLLLFGLSIFVYLDIEDDHTDFFINEMINRVTDSEQLDKLFELREHEVHLKKQLPLLISVSSMAVSRKRLPDFEKQVSELEAFLKIFKKDLQRIEIEKKQEKNSYRCELVMVYPDYSLNAEFESTGIKKLIRLFAYLQKMVEGNIVFIDELDSNLHDVYLCALLEYLMEYGEGQLCFTTHNIGPMDILKRNKNSIDFLSVNKKIYSWKKSGNYSPSKLYRNGMIEGSPFNIDSFDFIGVFDHEGREE
ncbi:MAG: hypothetical protein U0L06_10525 [Agathobacter sp.]|nr:hypothetical protein [Agathobacter sp.]